MTDFRSWSVDWDLDVFPWELSNYLTGTSTDFLDHGRTLDCVVDLSLELHQPATKTLLINANWVFFSFCAFMLFESSEISVCSCETDTFFFFNMRVTACQFWSLSQWSLQRNNLVAGKAGHKSCNCLSGVCLCFFVFKKTFKCIPFCFWIHLTHHWDT